MFMKLETMSPEGAVRVSGTGRRAAVGFSGIG
jgi:hypothetical protein